MRTSESAFNVQSCKELCAGRYAGLNPKLQALFLVDRGFSQEEISEAISTVQRPPQRENETEKPKANGYDFAKKWRERMS